MERLEQRPFQVKTLLEFGTDLTAAAEMGKLDPVIGRKQEIERCMQILCKRRKNNVCLIGDPGVGKTGIVEALAQNISDGSVPQKLLEKKVFSIDMGRLIAGTRYRGDFEERLMNIVNEVKQSNDSIILFIDELHTLIGYEALDAANILKPALARGELKCIGATTQDEYRRYIETDPALERRFQVIEVSEPSTGDAIEILKSLKNKYQIHHGVTYTDSALTAAVLLSKQYISDRYLPDKAIDLIDEAGARVQLRTTGPGIGRYNVVVTEEDVREIVSMWTGIPVQKVTSEVSNRLINIEKTLRHHLIGQDEAVSAVSRAIRRARVGLKDPSRPIASFLFTGPTGVGKTQLAKLLASEYFGSNDAMIRIDMSEYMEKHNVSRLIGSPPGYIGHDEGGQLTEAVRRKPHNLVLLDELEKAHSAVYGLLLQVLDDGRLTDGKGRTVDFSNCIIIMTSNIGGKIDGEYGEVRRVVAELLKESFAPEFLNRLDEIIVFKPLEPSHLRSILNVMLADFLERIKKINLKVKISGKVKDKLISEGYNPSYGARPLKRAITSLLEDNLAEKIVNGSVSDANTIEIDVENNEIIIS